MSPPTAHCLQGQVLLMGQQQDSLEDGVGLISGYKLSLKVLKSSSSFSSLSLPTPRSKFSLLFFSPYRKVLPGSLGWNHNLFKREEG